MWEANHVLGKANASAQAIMDGCALASGVIHFHAMLPCEPKS